MNYSIEIFDSVDQIDVQSWNSLHQGDDLFMDLRLLHVTAKSMVNTDKFRFLLARDESGVAVAATCLWQFTLDGTLLATDHWVIRALKRFSEIAIPLTTHRVLICGMPVSAGQSNLRFAAGADRDAILEAMSTRLMELAKKEGLQYIIFKEFEEADPELQASMARLRFRRGDSLPMNQVDPQWSSFEAYLASMPSKKRSQIKNTNKKVRQGRMQLSVTSDPDLINRIYTDEVHELYKAVLGNSETKLETLPPTFFRELSRQFPNQTTFSYVMDGDIIQAFGVVLYSQAVAYPLYVGVNYDLNNEFDLYFNVMFSMFEESLRRGVTRVSWGQTADQFKQMKLNCYQTPRHFYVRGTNWFSKALIGSLFTYLFPVREAAPREIVETPMKRAA